MRATTAWVLLFLLAGIGCGFGRPGPGRGTSIGIERGMGLLTSRSEEGRPIALRRFDGSIAGVFRARVTSEEEQLVVFTGSGAGSDQGMLFLLSADSREILARHRAPNHGPIPIAGVLEGDPGVRGSQSMWGDVRHLMVFDHEGRRYLTYVSRGVWSPAAVVVLEAVDGRLEHRVEFWNNGHLQACARHGRWLVFLGLRRSTERPGVHDRAVGMLDLEALPDAGDAGPVVIDSSGDSPSLPPFARYHSVPMDRVVTGGPYVIEFRKGRVRCALGHGMALVVDPEIRSLSIETNAGYERLFESSPARPSDVSWEDHVRKLREGVRAW